MIKERLPNDWGPVVRFRPEAKIDKPVTVVFVAQGQRPAELPALLRRPPLAGQVKALHVGGQFSEKRDEIFPLVRGRQIVLLAGLGKKEDLSPTSIRMTVRKAMLTANVRKAAEVEVLAHSQDDDVIRGIIEGIMIGTYSWGKYRTRDREKDERGPRTVYVAARRKKTFADDILICQGTNFARDLVNDNADVVTADYLEAVTRDLVKGQRNVRLEVLSHKELAARGLHLHLAVNQGSVQEPKLIIVQYDGGPKKEDYTAFVGKGITFDTGGLNLKTSGHIETMRTDMAGAAAVIGVLKNALALSIRKNIVFAIGIAENAIGSRANKPGDIIKSYNGMTVEIGNTDAEGRLVLADAMAYVAKNYRPARMIDVATLTGACIVALGYDYSGLVSSDEVLACHLLESAQRTDDRAWRLPSYPEIKEALKSPIADIRNIGYPRGAAGTLTAAEFLRQFADDIPWAHMDIAGTAFVEEKGRWYYDYGATGAGVRLLTDYLLNT